MNIYATNAIQKRDEIRQVLLDHGIQPTSQRVDIAMLLLEKHQHLSAGQVLGAMEAQGCNVSKATVYNTLNLFVGKNLIRQVAVDSGPVFYDSNTRHHHHFYHEDTGVLEDIAGDCLIAGQIPPLPENTVQTGFDITIRVRSQL